MDQVDLDLCLRLSKQRIPLLHSKRRLSVRVRELRKELYNVSWKLKEIDDEILRLTIKDELKQDS